MRWHSHLNSAVKIIGQYTGEQPFSVFLKNYFSANKKFGSKDRKQIAHLCYCYFRLGKAIKHVPIDERILIGLFLCSTESTEILKEIRPEWNSRADASIHEKTSLINHEIRVGDIFPWSGELSDGINHEKFCASFLIQPHLYLRIMPPYRQQVITRLGAARIDFNEIEAGCLSFPNATKIENILELDREAVVQDYNSQKTAGYIQSSITNLKSKIKAWDCCAGSGGKSLLLYDLCPEVDLTVSDVRASILTNLEKRFAKAGIKRYTSFLVDLSNLDSPFTIDHSPFDLIICDAPCTGSGTWSRTPEQLYFFDDNKIDHYASLQRRIISNVIPHLKPGGFFIYITCSVFRKENEEMAQMIRQEYQFRFVNMDVLKGYDKKADTMFVSLFTKAS
ncbi:MAG TPA: methyltransferase domain-containing protein [Chitinophagaceae bacterium]|nr:methyltransferase domain-containing protein [Chitinophagaceae bacterium]